MTTTNKTLRHILTVLTDCEWNIVCRSTGINMATVRNCEVKFDKL